MPKPQTKKVVEESSSEEEEIVTSPTSNPLLPVLGRQEATKE